ncbi:hypothetical protein RLPCCGM1_p0566 [Rhizobium leguminosarum bv. phaseoli CCGM1]|nr:hypothetical protein RLPCCGM1_p0566 [Rhizobium leguminosarum bv. phaseoli CCGM1]
MASAFDHDDLKASASPMTRAFLPSFNPPSAGPITEPDYGIVAL